MAALAPAPILALAPALSLAAPPALPSAPILLAPPPQPFLNPVQLAVIHAALPPLPPQPNPVGFKTIYSYIFY